MQNIAKIMAGVALLATAPTAMTTLQPATQAPQRTPYMAATVLASLGTTGAPDHNVHGAGCGCAACQGCQVINPATI